MCGGGGSFRLLPLPLRPLLHAPIHLFAYHLADGVEQFHPFINELPAFLLQLTRPAVRSLSHLIIGVLLNRPAGSMGQ